MTNTKMKFYCDESLCIDCNGCVVACKEAHELDVGINRRRVITINEGIENLEMSLSVACMHCTDAPCKEACPKDCFYIRDDGIVLHDKGSCVGCKYCLYACPFGAPQFPEEKYGYAGVMDKCTMCAGGPVETYSSTEYHYYGQNRMAEGKVPMCAAMCSTKALVVGDSDSILKIYEDRKKADSPSVPYGWKKAYND